MAQGDQATRPMNFQVPEEMRTMAERSVTQARQALESYLHAAAHQREYGADQREGAGRNQGHGPEDPLARTQTEAMQAQMKEYGSFMQSAMETAKGIAQSAAETMKDATQTVTDAATHAKDKVTGAARDTKDKGTRK